MKKRIVLLVLLCLALCGCSREKEAPAGDFSFRLPEGYSLSEITESRCAIAGEKEKAQVGGMETTMLDNSALTEKDSEAILLYLQENFHGTNDVEFIASRWGDDKPLVSVNLKTGDGSFSHLFFRKGEIVYHMWFDLGVILPQDADLFNAIALGGGL